MKIKPIIFILSALLSWNSFSQNFYDVDNTLILAKSSELYFGENLNVVRPDEILFIPGGRQANIAYGAKDGPIKTQD